MIADQCRVPSLVGVDYDNKQQKKAIFRIEGDNKYWAEAVDSEHKNYDYL
jgi:alpha-amylase